jgi:hypothetical protein
VPSSQSCHDEDSAASTKAISSASISTMAHGWRQRHRSWPELRAHFSGFPLLDRSSDGDSLASRFSTMRFDSSRPRLRPRRQSTHLERNRVCSALEQTRRRRQRKWLQAETFSTMASSAKCDCHRSRPSVSLRSNNRYVGFTASSHQATGIKACNQYHHDDH